MRKIMYVLAILSLTIIPVLAQSPLTVNTDKESYYAGERVHIYGQTVTDSTISILINANNNIWLKDAVFVPDGEQNYEYITEPLPLVEGRWTVVVEQLVDDVTINAKTEFYVKEPTASIKFDKDRYVMNDIATITLAYEGANNYDIIDMKDVIVWSDEDRIKISLVETGYNTGIFIGKILLTNNANNGLQVKYGDIITAHYEDKYVKAEVYASINNPPVIQYQIRENDSIIIDASSSYDLDEDKLTFRWIMPIEYKDNGSWIEFKSNDDVIIELIVSDGYEEVSEEIRVIIQEQIFPLIASIDAIDEAYEGFEIQFDARVSGGVEPYSYRWDIKGEIINSKNFVKAFDAGIYNITLTVTDSSGSIDTDSIIIKILEPIIKVEGDMKEGSQLTFGIEPVIDDAVYIWTPERIEGRKITKVYDNDGIYSQVLTIKHLGQEKTYERKVSIDNVPPEILLTLNKEEIVEGESIIFNIGIDDAGNDIFNLTLYSNEEPIFQTETDSKSITYERVYNKQGRYEHYVIVNDGKDKTESRRVYTTVNMSLLLPVIVIGTSIAAGSGILYMLKVKPNKIKSKPKFTKNITIEYDGGRDKTLTFRIDIEGGRER